VISATNAVLREEVAAGRFREDLLFRLNTVEIHVPPLRNRRENIAPLARHFLTQHAVRYRKRMRSFDADAMQALLQHQWPGNIRELDHAVERAVLMADAETVKAADLALRQQSETSGRLDEMSIDEVEQYLIKKTLARFQGNVSQAAQSLGLSRSALYRRLQRYGL
jgi:DNA-binding NtrC family response regulator